MIETEIIEQFDQEWESGRHSPKVWRDFWWRERAETLNHIRRLQDAIDFLRPYTEVCSVRIQQAKDKLK